MRSQGATEGQFRVQERENLRRIPPRSSSLTSTEQEKNTQRTIDVKTPSVGDESVSIGAAGEQSVRGSF